MKGIWVAIVRSTNSPYATEDVGRIGLVVSEMSNSSYVTVRIPNYDRQKKGWQLSTFVTVNNDDVVRVVC